MKTKTILVVMALVSCLLAGCEAPCPLFGMESEVYPGSIIKFREGQDMSNNIYVYLFPNRDPDDEYIHDYTQHRPIPLKKGYYLIFFEQYDVDTINRAFISFTYDDLENGVIPSDWRFHWQEYGFDTVRNPFEAIYNIIGSRCDKNNAGIPFYCDTCSSTFYVNIALLNQMLDADTSFLTNSEFIIPKYIRNH